MTLMWEKKEQVTANVYVEASAHTNNTWSVTVFKYINHPQGERVYFFQGRQVTRRGTLKQARKRFTIAREWAWDAFSTREERFAALNRVLEDYPY